MTTIDERLKQTKTNQNQRSIARIADDMMNGKLTFAHSSNLEKTLELLNALTQRRVPFEVVPDEDAFGYTVVPHLQPPESVVLH